MTEMPEMLSDDLLLATWIAELSAPYPDIALVAGLEAQALERGWDPQRALQALLAADFTEDLHPRGRDGKFIEKFGLIKLIGMLRGKDGKEVDATGRRGRVESISPDPKTPGRPNIRVNMLGKDGKPVGGLTVKPDQIVQAPEKARLDTSLSRNDARRQPGTSLPRPTVDPSKSRPQAPDRPQGEAARLSQARDDARAQARNMTDLELQRKAREGGPLWTEAVKKEQAARERRHAQEMAQQQALIDSVNEQAAGLSTTDADERAAGLDGILAKLRFSIIDTDRVYDHIYPPGESGRWTDERAAQHEEMWQELLANVEAAGIPQDRDALVLGGLPGAGKSYSLRPGQKAEAFGVTAWETNMPVPEGGATHVSINPDVVKEMLIDHNMLPDGISPDLKPMEQVTFIHEESSYLAKMFSQRLGDMGYNIVLDNTFDSEGGMLKRMTPLAREGYTFRALFADIPVEESKKSARQRYVDAALSDRGGRFVPSSVQGNRGTTSGNMSKNRDAFDSMVAQDWFTDYMVVDNTGVTDRKPRGEVTLQGTGGGTKAASYRPHNDPDNIRPGDVATQPGGPNKTTLTPQEASAHANEIISGTPVTVELVDVDDVIGPLKDSPEPVDLTLLSQFAAMRDSGRPRSEMPQIPKQHLNAFQTRLRNAGVKFEPEMVDPLTLSASQSELDGRSVSGIMDATRQGQFDLSKPIWISSDNKVLDGHHRWAAVSALSANTGGDGSVQIAAIRVDMPMSELLLFADKFNDDTGIERLSFGQPGLPSDVAVTAPAAA